MIPKYDGPNEGQRFLLLPLLNVTWVDIFQSHLHEKFCSLLYMLIYIVHNVNMVNETLSTIANHSRFYRQLYYSRM